MSLAATALILTGALLAIRALCLVLPDVEPDGTVRESCLQRKSPDR